MQYFLDASSGFDRAKTPRREASFCVSSVSDIPCSITKKVVFLDKIKYSEDMNEVAEDIFTTDKILYLSRLDGKSEIWLMRQLAKLAQELYDEYE